MNKVFLIGRLVRDAEVKYSKEMAVAKFTLAVDRRNKEKEADFIPCTAFGKAGELIEKYVSKGMKIAVEGRWQTGSYTNKEGTKVYTNDCIVDQIEFCESKKTETPKEDGFMNLPSDIDDEVPFPMG